MLIHFHDGIMENEIKFSFVFFFSSFSLSVVWFILHRSNFYKKVSRKLEISMLFYYICFDYENVIANAKGKIDGKFIAYQCSAKYHWLR